jgi:hypothetical protein
MITAQELREVQALNATAVNKHLGAIWVKLKVHADSSSKKELFLYVDGLWKAYEGYRVPYVEPSSIQGLIMKELTTRGYGVIFGKDPDDLGYVPRGLANDYGEGPTYFNVGLTIRW